MSNKVRSELENMLSDVPEEPYSRPGSGYFKIPEANAYICIDSQGRLGIYPTSGGWLGVDKILLQADVAPFSG